jgi:AcrR family transcriptional regulator
MMPRTAAIENVPERIRRAAIALFKARGYHGTAIRELARRVRVEAASLYYHFPSKQEILRDVFAHVMDDLLGGLQQAVNGSSRPEERLRAAVRFHVQFHIERQAEAFISHSELRSLSGPNLRRTLAQRDRYERMFRALLVDGIRSGAFRVRDVPVTTIAILTMCSGVSDWFSSQGRLSAAAVAEIYADMVLQLLSAGGSVPPHRRSWSRSRRSGASVPRQRGPARPSPGEDSSR